MPLSNKHGDRAGRIFCPAFNKGLDLSMPAESIELGALKEAMNVEFSRSTGAMSVRGGLVWNGRFDMEIDQVIDVPDGGFLVKGHNINRLWYFSGNCVWPVTGGLSNENGQMIGAGWGEPGEMVVASGGKLQRFHPRGDNGFPSLMPIKGSPDECRNVFVRDGRVGVVDGPDTLRFSWVGDCEQWDNDPDDESTGQFIEIGYKDGMDINAIVPLSKDLIIFKCPEGAPDKGIIWRLVGSFPEWYPVEVAHDTGTFSQRSVAIGGNDVFYLTPLGLTTLWTVTQYGEVRMAWPDQKVAPALRQSLRDDARLWSVPVKEQLWVRTNGEEKEIWVFDYGLGIWTQIEFPVSYPLIHVAGIGGECHVFIYRDIYELSDWYWADDIEADGGVTIKAKMQMGTILKGWQTLIKGAMATFHVVPSCRAELRLGEFKMPFVAPGEPDYIADPPNTVQYAYEDDDPLFPPGNVLTSRRRCLVRDWAIVPEVVIEGGGFALSTMALETVEV